MAEQNNKYLTISTYNAIAILVLFALITVLISGSVSIYVHDKYTSNSAHSSASEINSNKLLVHVSSGIEDPHSIMMGINKALKANEAGMDVMIFFDVKATDAVLDSTDITFADFAPSKTLINQLINDGVEVYVCPHCLMVNGNNINEVMPGVKELTMESMMKFSSGGVTTLDY
jgi:predicted peroxiredoxin